MTVSGDYVADIDECAHNTTECRQPLAECVNYAGGFHCSCREGYSGNGSFCEGDTVEPSLAAQDINPITYAPDPIFRSPYRIRTRLGQLIRPGRVLSQVYR